MSKKTTLKELSKTLGVSVSTISKALNDSYEISTATKERIKEAAKLYNYQPNRVAVNLKLGKTNTIGVIIPSVQNFFHAQVLLGIERVVANSPYNIIVSITNESLDKEIQTVENLSNGIVDGFIIAVAEETQVKQKFSHFETAIKSNKKVLMFDRAVKSIDCDKVQVNDENAVFNAVMELFASGNKKIALTSTINNLSVGKQRTKGYRRAVERYHDAIIIAGSEQEIEDSVSSLVDNDNVNAIIALDEESFLATFRAGNKKKVLNNGQLTITGYASKKIAENLTPSLTTIDQQGEKIGEIAANLLLKKLENRNLLPESIIVDSILQQR